MYLAHRVVDFEQRLLALDEDIQAFKKKEVMNMDEMRNNVGNLKQITDRLDAALMELEVRVAALSKVCVLPCDTAVI